MSFKHRANNLYTPNVHDPLVIKRVNTALNYFASINVGGLIKAAKQISLSHKEIFNAVGDYSDARRPLSINLATTLLIPASTYHTPGTTKTYFINWHMYEYWDRVAKGEYLTIAEFKRQVPAPDKPSIAQIEFDKREQELQRLMNIATLKANAISAAKATDSSIILPSQANLEKKMGRVLTTSHISSLPQRVIVIYERIFDQLEQQHKREMQSQQFSMSEAKSNRYYHPIQKKSAEFKRYLFSKIGMKHHYDIEQAMLTIIVQQAKNNGMQEGCTLLENMMLDKQGTRKMIADSIQMPLDKTKTILNSLLNTTHPTYTNQGLFKSKLNITMEHFVDIFANPLIQQLQDEIDACWSYINPTIALTLAGDFPLTKYNRKSKDQSKIRAAYYFKMERLVVDLVKQQVEYTDNKWFREHDGWYTKNQMDIDKLLDVIAEQLRLHISINHTITTGKFYRDFTY
jgi:hypothetical protein